MIKSRIEKLERLANHKQPQFQFGELRVLKYDEHGNVTFDLDSDYVNSDEFVKLRENLKRH